jgi:hypothetical protein
MVDAIDLLEKRVAETFASLKEDAEALLRRLEQASLAGKVHELGAEHDTRSELDDPLAELLLD